MSWDRTLGLFMLAALASACAGQQPQSGDSTASGSQGGGGAGASTSSSASAGQGGDCAGAGGCAYFCQGCGDEADVVSCVAPGRYCGAELESEMWTVSASSCASISDGHYYFASREAGEALAGCPGWCGCVVGAYSLGPPYYQGGGADDPLPPGAVIWTNGGGDECEGYPSACNGLPFGIIDDLHPTIDAACSYQCTAGQPGETSGTATCIGPESETCSFDYAWENLLPWQTYRP